MVKKYNTFEPQLVIAERNESAVVLTNEQKLSLYKKSQKTGISTDILEEVYRRGHVIWKESFGQTAEQFAFDRVNSFIAGGFAADLDEDLRQWFDPKHPKGGWKRYNSKGEAVGPCAREPGEAKPKCMSNEKAASLSKKERAAAVAAKRRHDPNPERKGKPINVSNVGKGKISEMTDINEENKPTNPSLWSKAKSLAKQKFDVYPSAYANGWAAKWYKARGGGWKSVSEEVTNEDCWDGYKRVGMKKKGKRMVPNCVPEETTEKHSKDKNKPSSRFEGSDELVGVYKKDTPGQSTKKTVKNVIKENRQSYRITRGKTLSDISKRTGVSVPDLARFNNISDVNNIRAGDTLRLTDPSKKTATPGASAKTRATTTSPTPRSTTAEPTPRALTSVAKTKDVIPGEDAANDVVKNTAKRIIARAQEVDRGNITPQLALGTAAREGLNRRTLTSRTYSNPDAGGTSYGPFQLYSASKNPDRIASGGMAKEFKDKFKQSPSSSNLDNQIDFTLDRMQTVGRQNLGRGAPWYGIRRGGGTDAVEKQGWKLASDLGIIPPPPPRPKNLGESSMVSEDSYTVRRGDNLGRIARQANIPLSKIKELNPEIKDINKIAPGQKVRTRAAAPASAPAATPKAAEPPKQITRDFTLGSSSTDGFRKTPRNEDPPEKPQAPTTPTKVDRDYTLGSSASQGFRTQRQPEAPKSSTSGAVIADPNKDFGSQVGAWMQNWVDGQMRARQQRQQPEAPRTPSARTRTPSSDGMLSPEPMKKPQGSDMTLGSQRTFRATDDSVSDQQKKDVEKIKREQESGNYLTTSGSRYGRTSLSTSDLSPEQNARRQERDRAKERGGQWEADFDQKMYRDWPLGPVQKSKNEETLSTIKRVINEATHQGRKVTLNKPFRTPGGPKKSAVYVDPDGDGKAKIVRFGDPNLSIKKNQPGRKRSYCARSSGQGNLTKKDSANYWSRRAWDC